MSSDFFDQPYRNPKSPKNTTSPSEAALAQPAVISLRLTAGQVQWLDNAARFLAAETGHNVSHASILMRLMENGLPQFERELEELRARSNAARKRFPKLHLIHTSYERPDKKAPAASPAK